MSRRIRQALPPGVLAAAVVFAALPVAGMQEEDTRHSARLHLEQGNESDDEGQRRIERHKVIFVDEQGEVTELEGEGEGFSWIRGGRGRHRMRMHLPHLGLDGGFLGVSTTPMTPELREHFGAPAEAGVLISQVLDDSAAFRAGLRVGDVLTRVDSESIAGPMELMRAIREREEGDAVTLEIFRDGRVETLTATLDESGRTLGGLAGLPRHFRFDCEEEGADCDIVLRHRADLCDGGGECEVEIRCDAGECTCTVDGAETDCESLEGIHVRPRP